MRKIFDQSPKTRIKIHKFSRKTAQKIPLSMKNVLLTKWQGSFDKKVENSRNEFRPKGKKILPQNKFPKVFVWKLRTQFWQWTRKTFATKWKEKRTKSGEIYETFIFSKKSYPLNDPLDTYRSFLITSPICLSCFPQRSSSNYRIITFPSRKFFTIMFFI